VNDTTLSVRNVPAALQPGVTLPNSAIVVAAQPREGYQGEYIVLAMVNDDYVTWCAEVTETGAHTWQGHYIPMGASGIGPAVVSFARRLGARSLQNLLDDATEALADV